VSQLSDGETPSNRPLWRDVGPLRQPTSACLTPAPNVAANTPPKAAMRQCSGLFDSLVRLFAKTSLCHSLGLQNPPTPMYEVCLGSETDTTLWAALQAVVLTMGGSIIETSWGVGGSQELITHSITLPNGHVVAESETYIGLSIRGPATLVDEIAKAVRALMHPT